MADLNTPDVIEEVSRRMQCYKKDAKELLEHFADVIAQALVAGDKVYFKPLGVFYTSPAKRPRQDGSRRLVVKFKPSRWQGLQDIRFCRLETYMRFRRQLEK